MHSIDFFNQLEQEDRFWSACKNRNKEIVKLLLELTGDIQINVHTHDDYGFRRACRYRHTEIVKIMQDEPTSQL